MRIPRAPAIFGAADGLTLAMGLVTGLTLAHQPPAAIWSAALSGGLAELPGMASGQYQSTPEDGKLAALICGLASVAGAVLPAVPYLVACGAVALAASITVAIVVCSLIAWLRPGTGWRCFAVSYGILAAAVGLCLLPSVAHRYA